MFKSLTAVVLFLITQISQASIHLCSDTLTAKVNASSIVFSERKAGHIKIIDKDKLMADATYQVMNSTLRFDIEVKKNYRGLGLYQTLLGYVLERYPNIEFIPAKMNYEYSENAEIFLQNAFLDLSYYVEFVSKGFLPALSKKDLIQYRSNIVRAIRQTPALKTREKLGFGVLTRLILIPSKQNDCYPGVVSELDHLSFEVKRGNKNADSEVEVWVVERETTNEKKAAANPAKIYKINAQGELTSFPYHESLIKLHDYNEYRDEE